MKRKFILAIFVGLGFFAQAQNAVKPVYGASKRPVQGGQDVGRAFDDNPATLYQSYYDAGPISIPDTIDFYFNGVQDINKLEYLPRQDGLNGTWTTIDVYYATASNPEFVSVKTDVIFAADISLKTIDLAATPLLNPKKVRIIAKSAFKGFSTCAEMKFYSSVPQSTAVISDCEHPSDEFSNISDTKHVPTTATVSPAAQNASLDASKTIDGDFNTFYHSNYSLPVSKNPITLTYTFGQPNVIEQLKYTPRPGGGNGDFGAIEIWYKQTAEATEQKLLDFNCGFRSSFSLISLPQTLTNVYQVIVKVNSGENENASCGEMEFFQLGTRALNQYTNIFNSMHSALKPGVGQADIDGISSPFFKSLAQCLFNQRYNSKYRMQTMQPFPTPGAITSRLKSSGVCPFENPTGIAFKANTKAIIYVGPTNGSALYLHTCDFEGENNLNEITYPLVEGMNIVNLTRNGLAYIDYFTDSPTATPVQVNVTTGLVNGFYDPTVDTDEDWQALLTNNVNRKIDLKGTFIMMNIDKDMAKLRTFPSGKLLINRWDMIVKKEYELMGLYKYNIVPKNHMFAFVPIGGGLYASGGYAHFGQGVGGGYEYIDPIGLFDDLWGPSHELGHINQVRPAFKWHGMTEVTNNIYSGYCQFLYSNNFPNSTRYDKQSLGGKLAGVYYPGVVGGEYNADINIGLVKGLSLYEVITDKDRATCRTATIPYWQLMLYYSLGGGGKGLPTFEQRLSGTPAPVGQVDVAYWLPDFLEVCRNLNTSGMNDVQLMLTAIKNICDVLHEDLSDFFIKSGYLRPVDKLVDDYGNTQITVTEADIANTVAAIKAKNYPAPVTPVLNYISSNSLPFFKNKAQVTGTANVGVTLNTNADPALTTVTVNAQQWQNVVAFETYNQKTLSDVAIFGTADGSLATTKVRFPQDATSIYAVGYDGTRKLVYPSTDPFNVLPVKLISFDAKKTANGVLLSWKTDNEQNNAKFEIYKKTNNGNFEKISEQAGAGTTATSTSYQHLDKAFNEDAYYYLKQVDQNGVATAYDQAQWIRFVASDQLSATVIYPNPASTSFSVKTASKNYQVKLTDVNGKVLQTVQSTGNASTNVSIAHLPSGVYLVQVISETGVETKKLIKK